MNDLSAPYFSPPNNPIYLQARIDLARKAKSFDSGVALIRNNKVVTLKGRALDYHIRQLKKELAAFTQ
jgi:hypothetical protein